MASKEFNQAGRLLAVMDRQIEKGTKSGARIDVTYGQVWGVLDGYASVYIAGAREVAALTGEVAQPSDYFRIPTFLDVAASDYVRVSMDARGHRWIDEVLGPTKINALSIKVNGFDIRTRLPGRIGAFELVDVPASKADGSMALLGGSISPYSARPISGAAGKIVGIAWRISAAPSAGSVTLHPAVGGSSQTDGTVIITSSSSTTGFVATGTAVFTAGQSLGINIESSADLSPTTLDVSAWLLFEQDAWSI